MIHNNWYTYVNVCSTCSLKLKSQRQIYMLNKDTVSIMGLVSTKVCAKILMLIFNMIFFTFSRAHGVVFLFFNQMLP